MFVKSYQKSITIISRILFRKHSFKLSFSGINIHCPNAQILLKISALDRKPPQLKQHIPHDATKAFLAVWYNKIETLFFLCNMNFISMQMFLNENVLLHESLQK